ncbi:ABC transporter permease subunit [Halomonas saccharevitans]|uniref:Glutamate/aspartate import permease protein GltK n=1 Tax=Halomonas saccharevitans TaxID=416872 RepID=A0A1I7C6V7_9GAMM|nr:ABC transporter permease subunit [Halomonas saccharevitans]MDT8878795.1 ABC transporter permease subunit [Halomonas saccharevitans]SFT95156.1 amino acid ABC transporter membrane protein 2, PAAT family [Halomonas saccharevitans]
MSDFDFQVIIESLPFLFDGLLISFQLTLLALLAGLAWGTILAVMRIWGPAPLRWFSAIYVNIFRSIPLILVIFWFYFLVPLLIGRPVGNFTSALIAFSLFEAAYYAEIMRAGLNSVSRGQVYAGLAIGLSPRQNLQYVILPQAFRNMIPVLLTQAIILFQDTSLVYVVALSDFMTSASTVAKVEGRLAEMYLFAALVYFVICFSGSMLVKHLQKKKVA